MEGFGGYTMDKAEADADPTKILIKKNSAGTGGSYDGVDENHKNFKAWKEKAKEKYESEIIAQVDRTTKAREIKYRESKEWEQKMRMAKDRQVQELSTFGSVYNSGLVSDGAGNMIPNISAMKAAVSQLEGTSFKRADQGKGSSTVINKVTRGNNGVIIDVTDISLETTTDTHGKTSTHKVEKPRTREITFENMNNDDFVETLYTHIYGFKPPASFMNAYRNSPQYKTIDQNQPSQFTVDESFGGGVMGEKQFVSSDDNTNQQATNPNDNWSFYNPQNVLGTGTSKTTTGYNFKTVGKPGTTGATGATGNP